MKNLSNKRQLGVLKMTETMHSFGHTNKINLQKVRGRVFASSLALFPSENETAARQDSVHVNALGY